MRVRRSLVIGAIAVVPTIAIGGGCRTATEATIDIQLVRAQCSEIHGTALTVGVTPPDTEQRVHSRFVTATTTDCAPTSQPQTSEIGTIVLTPSDPMRASIVVVAAYGTQVDPSACTPPGYVGCIVARRTFSFIEHDGLSIPVTIDPNCVNVPCDAFSTCRDGKCFSSDVTCGNGMCAEPGATSDGGTDLDASVMPDSPTDGNPTTAGATCTNDVLACGNASCGPSDACCVLNGGAVCTRADQCPAGKRLCCTSGDCAGQVCKHSDGVIRLPNPAGTPDGAAGDDGGGTDSSLPSDAASDATDSGGTDSGNDDSGTDSGTDSGATAGGTGVGICVPPL